jgi:hypothetical protein
MMQRRIGFIISAIGLGFLLLPLSRVLPPPDFLVCAVGAGFIVLGIFSAIESVAKRVNQKP